MAIQLTLNYTHIYTSGSAWQRPSVGSHMFLASVVDGQMPKRIFKGSWRLVLQRTLARQSRISKLLSCPKPSFDRIGAWVYNVRHWPSNTSLSFPLSYLLLACPGSSDSRQLYPSSFSQHPAFPVTLPRPPIPREPRLQN